MPLVNQDETFKLNDAKHHMGYYLWSMSLVIIVVLTFSHGNQDYENLLLFQL
jgi:hypothetical protein